MNEHTARLGRNRIPMPVRYLINGILIAALIAFSAAASTMGLLTSYYSGVLVLVGINIILAVSLNISTGYLGQLPLGHAGFMAVGAYTGGIFLKAAEAGDAAGPAYVFLVVAALLLSGVVAGIFGIIIGVPALRIISLCFVFAGFSIICSSTFQALGNGLLSMMISIVRQLLILLPAAFFLSLSGSVTAVWWAFPIAELASLALCVIFLRRIYRRVILPLE